MATLQPEEIARLFQVLEGEPLEWQALVHLALVTGARRGEVVGLKWENLDFETGVYLKNEKSPPIREANKRKNNRLCGELCGDQKVNTSKSKKSTPKNQFPGCFLQADGQNRTDNLLITRLISGVFHRVISSNNVYKSI